jgi:hypothetical protein
MANIERLRQLRRVVAAAPDDERFDMRYIEIRKECGTAHCAYGWAQVDPWFRDNTPIAERVDIGYPFYAHDFSESPGIFDLISDDAENLFSAPRYGPAHGARMKAMVLANIDRLLAGQPSVLYPDITDSSIGDPA